MFGFFKRRKQKDTTTPVVASADTAPGTQISYHPDLVPELLDDHQVLLELFGKISHSYDAGEYGQLPSMLQEFGALLRGHLLKENIKLYVYLQHALANDPDNAALMQGFRKEMNGISRTVTRFLKHYGEENWDRQRQEKFGHDLQAIGEVLVKRIETEESVLYPLYMPPGSYA